MQNVSRITGSVIKHPNFEKARSIFLTMCRDATDGLVLLLVGPTQNGKSIILQQVVSTLQEAFRDPRAGAIPIVYLQIETVSEGRTKPKWLGIELLKALNHPIYKYIGCLDENDHYFPSKGRDEGTIRIAVKEGFSQRFTRRVCLDEVHLLTRTKDPDLRASILESVKSACAIDRTLIASGGYEMAYKGLFDSSHFCGRVLICELPNYVPENKVDRAAWLRILKTYSPHLQLKPDTLLVDECFPLMTFTNGVIGLLDKMLWLASVKARAMSTCIDKNILFSSAPPKGEQTAIKKDIEMGKRALSSADVMRIEPAKDEEATDDSKKSGRVAFERNPDRNPAMDVNLYADD